MEQTKYLIGDVANLIGMSRDTLRHYEKLGILSSEKGDNGYRYYTAKQIDYLDTILPSGGHHVSEKDGYRARGDC